MHYYILHNILLYNAPYKIYTAVYITIYCNIHCVMCCRLFTEERRILFDQVEQYIHKYGCQSNKMQYGIFVNEYNLDNPDLLHINTQIIKNAQTKFLRPKDLNEEKSFLIHLSHHSTLVFLLFTVS